ncbi:ribonuclease HII [Xanthomarina sp. F2636L]|uniref:ribonuclease HII n=1 Tax=Xanthomarina sp. F2636L TaxID=2996018 RepID=UPI00225E64A2|nr:ribonuclease HII [Xanthomarina sp. F2636L]MCX7550656.1 ribonuclease HII [Xanthomarina sp. F2636L]
MKGIFYFILITLFITSCSKDRKFSNPSDYIPENASIVLQASDLESLKNNINNNNFLEVLTKSGTFSTVSKKIKALNYFKTSNNLFLCFTTDKDNSLQYSIITTYNKDLFDVDSLPNHKIETISTKKHTITKTTIDNNVLFSVLKDSIFIGSSNLDLLTKSLDKKNNPLELVALLNTSDKDSQLSVLINENNNYFNSFFLNDSISKQKLANYIMVDIDLKQDEILLNGIAKATDSTKSLINVFKNTIPQENQLAKITPSNSDGFLSFTFNNYSNFKNNLRPYQTTDSIPVETTLFDNIVEVGVIFEGNQEAIVLNSLDDLSTNDALLNEQNLLETYRDIDIYSFSTPNLFKETFSPFIHYSNASLYCVIDNFFVFGHSIDMLQNIIANYQNNTTLQERPYFEAIKENLSDEASLMLVLNPSKLNNKLEQFLNEDLSLNLDNYKTSAIQFIYDTNFAHINAVIKKNKIKAIENSVTEEFNIKITENILNTQQFVINHESNQKEIVLQDVKNNLYLISNTGKLLWKKQLDGAVLGKVEQIDMYKNGRLQLAFATQNRVYVLDRNGKEVAPFPLKFNDKITQPLSVFDYDNNRNYRLLITQGKNIIMLDQLGKTVKGFTFKSADNNLIHQPQHIRIGKSDYLLFKTSEKLYILDRVGKTRVSPKKSYNYSNQAVYLYNNKFTTTTKDGKLVTIDVKGNTSEQNLQLTDRHHIETTSKTLVAQSENKLIIKNKTLEMDYGNYTKPDIFYLYDKIYISVTDLQAKKIYLFDSQGKSISNFPVYGNSRITLDNIDKDRNLELVTKGDDNSILIYQIN